jgi:hypothetical protein
MADGSGMGASGTSTVEMTAVASFCATLLAFIRLDLVSAVQAECPA